ncbi:unnamed protein product [Spodoptera exigua]|nr:unnamed protein product [Spodoptera exigua]
MFTFTVCQWCLNNHTYNQTTKKSHWYLLGMRSGLLNLRATTTNQCSHSYLHK